MKSQYIIIIVIVIIAVLLSACISSTVIAVNIFNSPDNAQTTISPNLPSTGLSANPPSSPPRSPPSNPPSSPPSSLSPAPPTSSVNPPTSDTIPSNISPEFSIKYADGNCLHPRGGSASPTENTELVFHPGCEKNRNEIHYQFNDKGQILHFTSKKCLGVDGNNNIVFKKTCGPNDIYKFIDDKLYHGSKLCISKKGKSDIVTLSNNCTDTDNNKFMFLDVKKNYINIKNDPTGYCIGTKVVKDHPGQIMLAYKKCDPSIDQIFVQDNENLKHSSGKCINVADDKFLDLTDNCQDNKFELLSNGSIRHKDQLLCFEPSNANKGKARENSGIKLTASCGAKTLVHSFVPVPRTT